MKMFPQWKITLLFLSWLRMWLWSAEILTTTSCKKICIYHLVVLTLVQSSQDKLKLRQKMSHLNSHLQLSSDWKRSERS